MLVVVALAAVGVGASPAAAADEQVVTVTPDSDLVDGDVVHVAISGVQPQTQTFTQLCRADEQSRCDSALSRAATADDAGEVDFDFGIEPVFSVLTGTGFEQVDCRAGPGCNLVAFAERPDGSFGPVTVGLSFRADGPLLPPTRVVASPATDLVDAQSVRLDGSGFVPFVGVEVRRCRVPHLDGFDCGRRLDFLDAGIDGTFSSDVEATTVLVLPNGDEVDCRISACQYVITREDRAPESRQNTMVPVTFRPDGPLRPPPTLTVTPASGLRDQQVVQVQGRGYQDSIAVSQCAPGSESAFDRCTNPVFLNVVADELVTTEFTIDAEIPAGAGTFDCRVAPGCTLAAFDPVNARVLAEASISFAAADPTVAVTPATDLLDGALVHVAVAGAEPFGEMFAGVCAVADVGEPACATAGGLGLTVGADGRAELDLGLDAVFRNAAGETVDCRVAPGCAVVVLTRNPAGSVVELTAPLGFRADGPLRPPSPPHHHGGWCHGRHHHHGHTHGHGDRHRCRSGWGHHHHGGGDHHGHDQDDHHGHHHRHHDRDRRASHR
jgi:hypothetical protein